MNPRNLREQRDSRLADARKLVETAEKENRDFTAEEQATYDGHLADAESLLKRAVRLEETAPATGKIGTAPAVVRNLGDNELRAIAHYVRTGDTSGVSHLRADPEGEGNARVRYGVTINFPRPDEVRAVDSTMNITTAADGGVTVPTGLGPRIAARMNEVWLAPKLGCQRIPGVGTTVNHVYENADPVVFATKAEQADNLSTNDYERDAAVLATKAFTLVKKTKKLNITEELLEDNDVNLMEYIGNWIGRNMATTHNSMMLTEVAANGTALKTFAAAAAIAAGEPEDIVFNDTLSYYLDDASSAAWVMRPTSFGAISKLTGNARLYAETPGGSFNKEILGYPVLYSNNAAAIAASAKPVYFGDWRQVGYRLPYELKLITDPYSEDGVVVLKYSFRTVYGVLVAGGIGYGVHPSA